MFVLAPDLASDVESPFRGIPLHESQRFPGYGDLEKPACIRDLRFTVPETVPGGIEIAALVGDDGIPLGTVWIDNKIRLLTS